MTERKILYSPGFGAGWTTWESDPDVRRLMLTYAPLVEAVERGEDVAAGTVSFGTFDEEACHPAVRRLIADCRAMGKTPPYLGGLCDLSVRTVSGRVRIDEYDGSESVEEEGEYDGWL